MSTFAENSSGRDSLNGSKTVNKQYIFTIYDVAIANL